MIGALGTTKVAVVPVSETAMFASNVNGIALVISMDVSFVLDQDMGVFAVLFPMNDALLQLLMIIIIIFNAYGRLYYYFGGGQLSKFSLHASLCCHILAITSIPTISAPNCQYLMKPCCSIWLCFCFFIKICQ